MTKLKGAEIFMKKLTGRERRKRQFMKLKKTIIQGNDFGWGGLSDINWLCYLSLCCK